VDIDLTSGDEGDDDIGKKKSSTAIDIDENDEDVAVVSSPSSRPATNPPSSPSSALDATYDDMDLDAILNADAHKETTEDDEGMWSVVDSFLDEVPPPPKAPQKPEVPNEFDDGDDDMWDAVNEAEQQQSQRQKQNDSSHPVASNKPPSAGTLEKMRRADEEEWESMYA
jgi:hypothetical protein